MKEMSQEDREKAIDLYTEALNRELKKAMNFEVDTNYERQYSPASMCMYTTTRSTLVHTTKRPMTDDEIVRLAEGRL